MGIRSTAKALIVSNNKMLLNKCHDINYGDYYSLPGGGQNQYEALCDAVVRECKEETGYDVNPLRLVAVCEEICLDMDLRERYPDYAHKMYHIFLCEVFDNEPALPTEKDSMQVCSEWISIENLSKIRLLPRLVGERLPELLRGESPAFLGSENVSFNHG